MTHDFIHRKKLLILDLDGTLFNTLGDLAPAVNYALSMHGLPALEISKIHSFIGNGSLNLIARSIGEASVSLEAVHRDFLRFYAAHCTENTVPYPGVPEFLARDFRAALLTNKPEKPTRLILEHFGLENRFECVLCGDTAKAKKPGPEGIFQILETCRVAASDAVMIGDDTPDIQAALAVPVDSIAVLNGYGKAELLLSLQPTAAVSHFSDLLN
ncbi:MAG: HAD-IA family hydrolase [Fibrobacter sp.]|jgi:phosphoglycolate phosphatase|nr:HAD-IA family hydrolase [Fibrobacter sp.]